MTHKQLRKLALLWAAFAIGSILLMGCARGGGNPTANNAGGSTPAPAASCPSGDTVKTGTSTFEQSCITLAKGGTLKIVQDQTSFHILDYGKTGAPEEAPAGAPAMKDLQLSGASVNIGPFTTAGTFHIFCTVHPGMDLTVIVK